MYKIGIIGLGFMGGSIAKAVINSNKIEEIIAYDTNQESLELALKEGKISKIAKELEDFNQSDIVFICVPVGKIPEIVIKLKQIIKKDCIVTDIGSTKSTITKELEKIDVRYVGGHPMVGSERSGYATSNGLLFENAYYILTPNNNIEDVKKVKEVIQEMKAIPITIDADKHDHVVAVISHVPHIIASGLVGLVKDLDDENETMKLLAAGGFRDITRIASSNPTMWENICQENREEIEEVLEQYIIKLQKTKQNLSDNQAIYNFFKNSKEYRDSFATRKRNGLAMPTLNITIEDKQGTLAKVVNLLAENNINIKNIAIENNREQMIGALSIVFENLEDKERAYKILINNKYEVKDFE